MYELYEYDGYRQLLTFKCPDSMKIQKLQEWSKAHASRVRFLPQLRWYTICYTFDKIDNSDGSPGEPLRFDVFEEMYFNSIEDLKYAYDSDIMQQELSAMHVENLDDPALFNGVWAEANIIKMKGLRSPSRQDGCARLFGGCKRAAASCALHLSM